MARIVNLPFSADSDPCKPVCIMRFVGGRPCPKGYDDCSQAVYECCSCGYCNSGDPGYKYCLEECSRPPCELEAENAV